MKRSSLRPRLAALLIALCSCVGLLSLSIAPAWAAGTVTVFPVASPPYFITSGPDGNLWFTEQNTGQIGRITTSGTITEFPLPTGTSVPRFITAGPDGNLWFTMFYGNAIGRITTAGVVTSFALPKCGADAICGAYSITTGPNGNLWFTLHDAAAVKQITTSGSLVSGFAAGSGPEGITVGPDGNLWFTELGASKIGRFVAS